jgi:hypothetical protein
VLTRFARILLTMGSGESPWLIVTFFLGVIALGVLSNLVFSVAFAPGDLPPDSVLRTLIVIAVCVGLAYLAYRYDLYAAWHTRRFSASFDESQLAAPHAGLIWLLGPGNSDLPWFAIQYHHVSEAAERLQHCWLLITPQSRDAFDGLAGLLKDRNYAVTLHPIELEAPTIEATYRAVDAIYTSAADEVGLQPDQIVADLTGGLKTMTAGMVLACLPFGRALEYIESDRGPDGQPLAGTLRPIKVGVDFALRR